MPGFVRKHRALLFKTKEPEFKTFKEENEQLKQKLETLQRENNLLNDVIQLLKSHTAQEKI